MTGLVAYLFDGSSWDEAEAVLVEVVGSPVVSATPEYDGRSIPDVYGLSFSSVVPGVSATVSVAAASTANPYGGKTFSVLLDGATQRDDVVPGVTLVFSGSGSFSSSWLARLTVGLALGVYPGYPPLAGTPGTGVRVRVTNTGSSAGSGCLAGLRTSVRRVRVAGQVFSYVGRVAPSATEKASAGQTLPYSLQASNMVGSGAGKTMDVRADGSLLSVQDTSTLATGLSTALGVVDRYVVTAGPLKDLVFQLSQAASSSDEENVLVFPPRLLQLAQDSSGAPGDYGASDVQLSDSAGVAGVVGAGQSAYFWARALVPAGAPKSGNPYACDVALIGSAAVGWGT